MTRRRALVLALVTDGLVALPATAAHAAIDTTLTFPAGTVHVVDPSPASANEVRFTIPNTPTTRVFIDIFGKGEAHIALGSPAALGVAHAVYTSQSTAGCQVYTGTTFGEADEAVVPEGLQFDIRKDELSPDIGVVLEDSAGGPPNCTGFDRSPGRPVSFTKDPSTGGFVPDVTGIQWAQPGDATGLVAIPGPRAITLAWRPPADALGVKYEIRERRPDGSFLAIAAVGGSSTTIQPLAPGTAHTYVVQAFRQWAGPWPSPNPSNAATGRAVKPNAKTAKKPTRPTAPRSWRARAVRGRVQITLPKVSSGRRIRILRATTTTFARIATTTKRSYADRRVRRGRTYRYRLVLVAKDGTRSLPSRTIRVRVR